MTDLVVIGAGPGGYVAAIRAAQLGMRVAVVEKDACGGTCLNYGCIPTKALYKDAQVVNYLRNAPAYGIEVDGFRVNAERVRQEKGKVVKTLSGGVEYLLKANGVELVRGKAKILSAAQVEVTDSKDAVRLLETKRVLIASGSKAVLPPIPGIESPGVLTSKEALELTSIPEEIVIIGGGVIGIEFAGIYEAFGSQVTVVEFMPTLIPTMDQEITARLQKLLEKKGIRFLLSTKVEQIEASDGSLRVTVDQSGKKTTLPCQQVLVSTGRQLDVEGLQLDALGVQYDRKGISVDENYQTNVPGIYAIGDVIGGIMLAHVASEEGKVCVERIHGHDATVDYTTVPSAVFTFPEVAAIGLTEEELKAAGRAYTVGRFQFSGNGKALTMHETEGMVKVIADGDRQMILGVHIIGPNASDLLAEAATAMGGLFTAQEAAGILHGHPTLSEALEEALLDLFGTAIHTPPAKKK